nr:ABC transporter ATP-binding protein [Cohnella sp. WQ 127256]
MISLVNIERKFNSKRVLNNLSLTIYEREVTAIIGRNGSGKSTLLNIMSGLGTFNKGNREVRMSPLNRKLSIGYAPDRFPKLRFTAKEYLLYMGKIRGMDHEQLLKRISELFITFQLDTWDTQQLRTFSKGMLQKVNIMQALLEQPDLLLLDEPLSGLDIQIQDELIHILSQLKGEGVTIVLSTHERDVVQRIADRVIEIKNGEIASDKRKSKSTNPYKIVEFIMDEIKAEQCCSHAEGIIRRDKTDGSWLVHIEAIKCDAFVYNLLNNGGSIVTIGIERTANKDRSITDTEVMS